MSDDIDPELVALSKPPPRLGLVFVICMLILSGYGLLRMWPDFTFAMGANEPETIATPSDLLKVPERAFVRVQGMPDRTAPARVEGDKDAGFRLVPFLGTSRKVWLRLDGRSLFAEAHHDEAYQGRVRPLGALPYGDAVRAHFAAAPPAPRFVDPKLQPTGAEIPTLIGETVSVAPDTDVTIDERVPGVVHVTFAPTDRIKSEADARAALATAGLGIMPGTPPTPAYPDAWTFAVAAPEGPDAIRKALGEARYFGTEITERRVRHEARWGDLTFEPGAIRVAGTIVQRDHILGLAVFVPHTVPADAVVLLTEDRPHELWYVPVLFSILALLAGYMLWTLYRIVRG